MREFKNPKAILLLETAQELETSAYELEKSEGFNDTSARLLVEAAGLRVWADDIEQGFK